MDIICIWCDLTANDITAFSTFLVAIATLAVGIPAYLQYKKNTEIRSTELLISLYQKFYENKGDLKVIREWIDSTPIKSKEDFDKKAEVDKNFEEKFTDYLNFFQLIIVLKNSGQMKEIEIRQMFNYYLKLLKETEFIANGYLSANGYKELSVFLKGYKDDK
jgi:hypothetical protein